MKNELLEEYIRDNKLDKFDKEYTSSLSITLSDGVNKMNLMQCFDYVIVAIDNTFKHTYQKRKCLTNYEWCIID